MKFRMAERSLFAILLRSPWWMSLGIAGAFALLARLLMPADLYLFGAMGGFPFIVIAVMAARRQWHLPGSKRVQQTADAVGAMTWREFAELLEGAWRAQGLIVKPHKGTGADFELLEGRLGYTLASCRRWKAASLGAEPLSELRAAMERADIPDGLFISLGVVSPQAALFAKENRIRILGLPELAVLLQKSRLPAVGRTS